MISEAFITARSLAAGVDTAAPGCSVWTMDRAGSWATVAGFLGGIAFAIGKGVYWVLGKIFTDPLNAKIESLDRKLTDLDEKIDERWRHHDEVIREGKQMLDERIDTLQKHMRNIERGCENRHPSPKIYPGNTK
jgi:hypothetical protein